MPVIIAHDAEEAREYAQRLLGSADDAAEVQTDTNSGGVIGFRVSDALARSAGFAVTKNSDRIEGSATAPADAADVDAAPEAPGRNGSRKEWAAFLDSQDPPVTYETNASRDDLVALWDARK